MAAVAPAWVWGGVPMLLALGVVAAEWYGRQRAKQILYGLLMAFFLFVAVVLFIGSWKSTGGLTYVFLSIFYALQALHRAEMVNG